MNYYELRVTSNDKTIEIIDDSSNNFINEVEVDFNTKEDYSRTKSNAMTARIRIKGNIDRRINKQLQELFEWAKDFEDTTYRKVEIVIKDNKTAVSKTFSFDKMFVLDYTETYKSSETSDRGGTFNLFLSQFERSFDSAEVFLG